MDAARFPDPLSLLFVTPPLLQNPFWVVLPPVVAVVVFFALFAEVELELFVVFFVVFEFVELFVWLLFVVELLVWLLFVVELFVDDDEIVLPVVLIVLFVGVVLNENTGE